MYPVHRYLYSACLVACTVALVHASTVNWSVDDHYTFQDKDKHEQEVVTVTIQYTDLSQLPILAKRSYSNDSPAEFFILNEPALYTKPCEDLVKNNLEQLRAYYKPYDLGNHVIKPGNWVICYLKGMDNQKDETAFDLLRRATTEAVGIPLGEMGQNRVAFEKPPNKPTNYMSPQLSYWVASDDYMREKVGKRMPGLIRIALGAYVKYYCKQREIRAIRVQLSIVVNKTEVDAYQREHDKSETLAKKLNNRSGKLAEALEFEYQAGKDVGLSVSYQGDKDKVMALSYERNYSVDEPIVIRTDGALLPPNIPARDQVATCDEALIRVDAGTYRNPCSLAWKIGSFVIGLCMVCLYVGRKQTGKPHAHKRKKHGRKGGTDEKIRKRT